MAQEAAQGLWRHCQRKVAVVQKRWAEVDEVGLMPHAKGPFALEAFKGP